MTNRTTVMLITALTALSSERLRRVANGHV